MVVETGRSLSTKDNIESNFSKAPKAPSESALAVTWRIINTLNHAIIAIVTFYTTWLAFTNTTLGLFELHIALPTIGYQLLMAETILSLSGDNSWTNKLQPTTKRYIHLVLGTLGSGLALAGTACAIEYKSQHFNSPHGILGLVAMVMLVITMLNGPLVMLATKLKWSRPLGLKVYHNFAASTAFIFGIVTLILGFQKNWFLRKTSDDYVTCFIVFSSLTLVFTLKTPIINCCRHVRTMFRK